MKIRILQTLQSILFIAIGAIPGHYQGLSEGYAFMLGDMQMRVGLTQVKK